jgi:hypothetical protein
MLDKSYYLISVFYRANITVLVTFNILDTNKTIYHFSLNILPEICNQLLNKNPHGRKYHYFRNRSE